MLLGWAAVVAGISEPVDVFVGVLVSVAVKLTVGVTVEATAFCEALGIGEGVALCAVTIGGCK